MPSKTKSMKSFAAAAAKVSAVDATLVDQTETSVATMPATVPALVPAMELEPTVEAEDDQVSMDSEDDDVATGPVCYITGKTGPGKYLELYLKGCEGAVTVREEEVTCVCGKMRLLRVVDSKVTVPFEKCKDCHNAEKPSQPTGLRVYSKVEEGPSFILYKGPRLTCGHHKQQKHERGTFESGTRVFAVRPLDERLEWDAEWVSESHCTPVDGFGLAVFKYALSCDECKKERADAQRAHREQREASRKPAAVRHIVVVGTGAQAARKGNGKLCGKGGK